MKNIVICLLLISLSSCSTIIEKKLKVPIVYCPKPAKIEKPILPIDTFTGNESFAEIAVRYKQSLQIMKNYSESLEKIIKVYE